MNFFCKSQRFGKSLETFSLKIYTLAKKPATVIQQLTNLDLKIISVTSITEYSTWSHDTLNEGFKKLIFCNAQYSAFFLCVWIRWFCPPGQNLQNTRQSTR